MQQSKYEDRKEELSKALADVIESLRSSKNKSANLMSDEIGISKGAWLKLERGNIRSQFLTFCRIAEALDVSPPELLAMVYKQLPDNFSLLE